VKARAACRIVENRELHPSDWSQGWVLFDCFLRSPFSFIFCQGDFLVIANFAPWCCLSVTVRWPERKENIGWGQVSVDSPNAIVFPHQSVAGLSTAHESVIGIYTSVKRFPTMPVPSVTELSRVSSYQRRCVESAVFSPRSVASRLRCVKERFVASASVAERSVVFPVGCVPPCCVPPGRVASASQSSPRVALAPALQSLRRAALANKCARIAGRLARLAAGRPRQQLQ
jgi:hypothetical protein